MKLIPCLVRIFWNALQTSISMPGVIWSRNSTTVTSDPSRFQTEPSSSPITPAPITTSRFGTSAISSAPVEVTTLFSSTSTPGREAGSDPVAMTMFLAFRTPASGPSTVTSPGAVILPQPFT